MINYYEILEVTADASQEDIRLAYRRLARQWHPDVSQESVAAATAKFQYISAAYAELGDVERRRRFDQRWAHFLAHPEPVVMTPPAPRQVVVQWEGPGAKYRKKRGGRSRYFRRTTFFGRR